MVYAVPGLIRECGAAGIRNAIVLSAGFGETGAEGLAREGEMADAARHANVRFLGPNCLGLVRPWLGLNATFLKSSPPEGRLALVSQSGALMSAIADWAQPHHLGCSALVSLGNSTNIHFGDVVDFLANDAKTDAILLYVEGVKDARRFISALRIAARLKPVIVLKGGRQNEGSSDVGGVMTDLMSAVDVRAAFTAITERAKRLRPDATILGVTVEPMAQVAAARELFIAAKRDPVFGPAILFGAGGTMVEVLRDSAVGLPPLNGVLARRLIDRTRVARLLAAFRDRPAVDRRAVIDVLLRTSDLVCELPQIVELDINPLIVGPDGALVVDARIGIARPPANLRLHEHIAVAPYPRHLVGESVLADGTCLTIRPIRPEDAESVQTFVRELSPRAKRFRFMHAVNELTPEMLAQFTQIDYGREMALVAVTKEPGGAVQQGVARYIINPDETSCEFAIVISDRRQHQGIGTRLMQALMDAARGHGLKVMEGTVLAENHPMLRLMKDLGFSIEHSPEDRSLCRVERWL